MAHDIEGIERPYVIGCATVFVLFQRPSTYRYEREVDGERVRLSRAEVEALEAPKRKFWVYIGTKPECGCNVAVVVDEPQYAKETARDVADFIKRGYSVSHIEVEEGGVPIQRCPHGDWAPKSVEVEHAIDGAAVLSKVYEGQQELRQLRLAFGGQG